MGRSGLFSMGGGIKRSGWLSSILRGRSMWEEVGGLR